MVFGVAISLLFLQSACGSIMEHSTEEIPAAVEDTIESTGFLIDTHQAAGVSCGECHEESPASEAVSGSVCLTCHEGYKEATAGEYEDPHSAHISFPDCGSCHHLHQASENQCLACHAFEVAVP